MVRGGKAVRSVVQRHPHRCVNTVVLSSLGKPWEKWIAAWAKRGIPGSLLDLLSRHLLATPTVTNEVAEAITLLLKANEIRRAADVDGACDGSQNEPAAFDAALKQAAGIRPRDPAVDPKPDLYALAKKQNERVRALQKNHPLLRLVHNTKDDKDLSTGLLEALQGLIGYQPYKRRKVVAPARVTAAWTRLLQSDDPFLNGRLQSFLGSEPKKRIRLLRDAIIGTQDLTGLVQALREYLRDGSSVRIQAVHEQAFLNGDGERVVVSDCGIKAADIAAGLPRKIGRLADPAAEALAVDADLRAKDQSSKIRRRSRKG